MFKQIFLLITTLLAVAFATPSLPPSAALPNQQGLARLFFSSRITGQDPIRSMACFADYIAESNLISEKYSGGYNDCLLKSTASRKDVDQSTLKERQSIESSTESVCTRMRTCNGQESTLDMFNCHANAGSNNTKSTYAISGNAAEYATMLQEQYRLIDLRHEQCCHSAERVYVEDTAQNYNHLQACLDGRVQPRPPNETTTTTTEKPETTTTTKTSTTTSTTIGPPLATTLPELISESPQRVKEQFEQNLLN